MSDHELLFELLPGNGDPISRAAAHAAICEQLSKDVTEEDFDRYVWQLRERIVWLPDENLLCRSLGDARRALPAHINNEMDLEPWFERFIWKRSPDFFYDPPPPSFSVVVQNTARGGSRGGRWTRPDICAGCISRYNYAPVPQFDLFTFELKMLSGCNMLAVHEALAHAVAGHFPYLCLYLPEDKDQPTELASMLEQCQIHGVGVIVMPVPQDPNSYSLSLRARRHQPSPAKIDGFIDDRFDEANKLALQKWIRP